MISIVDHKHLKNHLSREIDIIRKIISSINDSSLSTTIDNKIVKIREKHSKNVGKRVEINTKLARKKLKEKDNTK